MEFIKQRKSLNYLKDLLASHIGWDDVYDMTDEQIPLELERLGEDICIEVTKEKINLHLVLEDRRTYRNKFSKKYGGYDYDKVYYKCLVNNIIVYRYSDNGMLSASTAIPLKYQMEDGSYKFAVQLQKVGGEYKMVGRKSK